MSEKNGVTFVLLRSDHTILMQLRDGRSKRYPYEWCLPGGSCDEDEEPVQTAIREVKEEYNLDVRQNNCHLVMIYTPSYENHTEYVYVCTVDSSQEPVLQEGAAMEWMSWEKIQALSLGFEQYEIKKQLGDFLKSFAA